MAVLAAEPTWGLLLHSGELGRASGKGSGRGRVTTVQAQGPELAGKPLVLQVPGRLIFCCLWGHGVQGEAQGTNVLGSGARGTAAASTVLTCCLGPWLHGCLHQICPPSVGLWPPEGSMLSLFGARPPGTEGSLPFCPWDTCVTLQALAEYAILSYAGGINLTVSMASANLDDRKTLELHGADQKLLQTAVVSVSPAGVGGRHSPTHVCLRGHRGVFSPQSPSLPMGLFVSTKGGGCCLMQLRLQGERVLMVATGALGPGTREEWERAGQALSSACGVDRCARETLGQTVRTHRQLTLLTAGSSGGDHVSSWVWGPSRKIHWTGFSLALLWSLCHRVLRFS